MGRRLTIWVAAAVTVAGCAGAVSEDVRTARTTVQRAQQEAGQAEPEELRVANSLLQRAEAAPNGSALQQDLAYLADRQARIAIANAQELATWEQLQEEQREYVSQLEDAVKGHRAALQRQGSEQRARQRQAAALSELGRVREEQGATVLTLSGEILFRTGQSELRPEARQRLEAVANALKTHPGAEIVVEGYTDSRGREEYNRQLSQRRANAVRSFLVEQGVSPQRIRAVGHGESQPVASNATPEGRADNRRVEIVVRRQPVAQAGQEQPQQGQPAG